MTEIDPKDAKILVRFLRVLHGWTPAELAERSGLAEHSICSYESGEAVPPLDVVERLASAARIPSFLLRGSLLSAVSFVRRVALPEPGDPANYRQLEETAETCAREAAELARGRYRNGWIRTVFEEEAKRGEGEAEAWRPIPAHREAAVLLWDRLASCSVEERTFLIKYTATFHSWALVERLAGLVLGEAPRAGFQALEWAELAVEVADRVAGEEGWPDRVRGYAFAALAHAQCFTGRAQAAIGSGELAELHWKLGASFPGLLEEVGFRALLASVGEVAS